MSTVPTPPSPITRDVRVSAAAAHAHLTDDAIQRGECEVPPWTSLAGDADGYRLTFQGDGQMAPAGINYTLTIVPTGGTTCRIELSGTFLDLDGFVEAGVPPTTATMRRIQGAMMRVFVHIAKTGDVELNSLDF